jgi:hypothetical protein
MKSIIAIAIALLVCATALTITTGGAEASNKGMHLSGGHGSSHKGGHYHY